MNIRPRYTVGETVLIGHNNKLGIIERILVREEIKISRDEKNYFREVKYDIRSHWFSIFSYTESILKPSEKQLHRDAFRVQKGQVILRGGKKYVVENVKEKYYSRLITRAGDIEKGRTWHVRARKLSNGKYHRNGQCIIFDQKDDEPIDIIGEMTDYKKNYK